MRGQPPADCQYYLGLIRPNVLRRKAVSEPPNARRYNGRVTTPDLPYEVTGDCPCVPGSVMVTSHILSETFGG